jgi:outer membrane immunogenic protein
VGNRIFAAGLAMMGICASLAAETALGADVPTRKEPPPASAPAAFTWTGFYFGANVGGAWGQDAVSSTSAFPVPPFAAVDVAAINAAASPKINTIGFVGGLQAGYNFQVGNIVWGFETDFDDMGLRGKQTGFAPFPSTLPGGAFGPPTAFFSPTTSVSTTWLYTARPRIGWALDNWLFFATGGLAVGQEKFAQSVSLVAPFATSNSFNAVRVGWALGGGVEYAVNRQWSLKGEYLYVDLGKTGANATTIAPAFAGFSGSGAVSMTANLARVGVNYHF